MNPSDPADSDLPRILWDIEQIKQLKARYFRLLDSRDWEGFRALFADDCTFDARVMAGVTSVDAFVAGARNSLVPGTSVHHGHMPEITITGPDTASGIWAFFDYVETEAKPGVPHLPTFMGYGHYREEYRRTPGVGWQICSWKLTRQRVDEVQTQRRAVD